MEVKTHPLPHHHVVLHMTAHQDFICRREGQAAEVQAAPFMRKGCSLGVLLAKFIAFPDAGDWPSNDSALWQEPPNASQKVGQ